MLILTVENTAKRVWRKQSNLKKKEQRKNTTQISKQKVKGAIRMIALQELKEQPEKISEIKQSTEH